jgi:hypothetical protein
MQCHLKEMMSAGWLRYTMFEGSTGVPQNRFWSDRTTNDRNGGFVYTEDVQRKVSCIGGEMQSWINLRLNVKDGTVC